MDRYSINSKSPNNSHLLHTYFKKTYLSELQHAVNQPLSAVLNYINGCLYCLKNQGNPKPHADIINALKQAGCETERIGEIFKTFSLHFHQDTACLHLQAIDINDLITKLIDDLQPTLKKLSIVIHLCLAEKLNLVFISRQYQNSLLWMMTNAIDLIAMDKSQRVLKLMTQQGQGDITMRMMVEEQEIFRFSIPLSGDT